MPIPLNLPASLDPGYVYALEQLNDERDRLMREIPECPIHGGQCIPHAVEWVQKARAAMNESTWEQKFAAMQGLGDASLKMHEAGKWYVHQPTAEVKAKGRDGKTLESVGATPEEAVKLRWNLLTGAVVDCRIGRNKRTVRWNGFMWADTNDGPDGQAGTDAT